MPTTTRNQKKAAVMTEALKIFFSSARFAVAGASSDPSKYGHKGNLTSNSLHRFYAKLLIYRSKSFNGTSRIPSR